MKIEIDLNDILGGDEDTAPETLKESIQRQVIDNLTAKIHAGINRRLDDEVQKVLNEELKKAIQEKMPMILNQLFTEDYVPVDRYGSSSGKSTNFRAELVKAINEQMVYKRAQYDSDKNVFTRAVDQVVSENVAAFKTEFNKLVDSNFTQEVLHQAQKKLQERLGIKPA